MRQITKLPEPASLTQCRATPGSTYSDYRETQALREQLVREQRGLCCYCLSRICAGGTGAIPPMKIAHWHSRNLHNEEQLDYSNLLGACMGNQGGPPHFQHCDTSQRDRDVKWNPANPDHRIEDRIRYLADGTIVADDTEFNGQINEVLNLNVAFLVNNRIAVLDSFKQALEKSHSLERLLREWNGETHGGELNEYCQIVVWWLRKRLARACRGDAS